MSHSGSPLDASISSSGGNTFVTEICMWFLRDRDDPWLASASWVRCLGALGIAAPSARTSLHRMMRGGYLVHDRRTTAPGYAMSPVWQELMGELDTLASPEPGRGPWFLVTFTVPEQRRDERHQLRSLLTRHGLGSLGRGVWIGTMRKEPQVRSLLRQLELDQYVELFAADHLGPGDSSEIAQRCWDIDQVGEDYRSLLERVGELMTSTPLDPREAFVDLVTTVNRWRLLRERDPDLPPEALPPGWVAGEVARDMAELIAVTRPVAAAYLDAALPVAPRT